MSIKMNKKQIEARKRYQRERYAKRKKEGSLPADRFSTEKRQAYNAWYRENKPGYFEDYYNKRDIKKEV